MSRVWVVFVKELIDGLRDRRAIMSLLLFPLVGPVLVSVILAQTADKLAGAERVDLPVVGREHAPSLMRFLEQQGVTIMVPPDDPVAAVRDGDVDLALIIPADYAQLYREGRPATVQLIVDESRTEDQVDIGRVAGLVQAHASEVGALRLLARGVSPDLAQPVIVDKVDLSTPKKRAAIFLNLIPMFVLIALFIGGMYTATDATAGERERGSFEPLLITPVTRQALVVGKWLVAVAFSMVTTVSTLACTLLSLSFVPTGALGTSLSLAPADVARLLAALLPLALFVAGAQMLVASFARTFKEAQTYLSLMLFLPMLPAMLTIMSPVKSAAWMMAVPVLGQQVLLLDVIRGVPVAPWSYVVSALAAALAGMLCVRGTAMLFRREQIIYGR